MYKNIADAVKLAIAKGTTFKCIIFVGENYGSSFAKYLTEANIVEDSFSIERSCVASNKLTYGDVISSELRFTIDKSTLGSEFDNVVWNGVHLYPFVYPESIENAQGRQVEVTIPNPRMAQTANDIDNSHSCVWCAKSNNDYTYGHIYGNGTYNDYLIPYSQYTVDESVENMYTVSISALDIVSSVLDTPYVHGTSKSNIPYFCSIDPRILPIPDTPDTTGSDLFARITQQTDVELPAKGLGYIQYPYRGSMIFSPRFFPITDAWNINNATHRQLIGYMAMTACSNIVADREYMKCVSTTWALPSDHTIWANERVVDWEYDENLDVVVASDYLLTRSKRYSFKCNNTEYKTKKSVWHLRKGNIAYNTADTTYTIGFYSNELLNQMPSTSDIDAASQGKIGYIDTLARTNTIASVQQFKCTPFQSEILPNPCIDPADYIKIDALGGDDCTIDTPITTIIFYLRKATQIDCASNSKPTNDEVSNATTAQTDYAASNVAKGVIQDNKKKLVPNYSSGSSIDYSNYVVYLVSFAVRVNNQDVLPGKMLCFLDSDGTNTYIRGSLIKLRDISPGVPGEEKFMISLLVNTKQDTVSTDYAVRHFGTNVHTLTIKSIEGII